MKQATLFYQLFEHESSTYTYIIADTDSKEAAIIDPVISTVDRDLNLIEELGLKLKYILDTHIHADHITGAGEIRKRTGALSAVSTHAHVNCVDKSLHHGDQLYLGDKLITALETPGHTDSCMSFVFENKVFTGDALLIRGCGRTDFQQGSAEKLYNSVHSKLFTLPDDIQVYPAHDYKGQTSSTIELEKKFNPRLGQNKSKAEFINIMANLKLAEPKKIYEAVPANLACGQNFQKPQREITVEQARLQLENAAIIDVRRPDEFNNELGHIKGAHLITLGPELTQFLEKGDRSQEIIFVCRSGARSGQAVNESIKLGYNSTLNMVGGMIRWNEFKFPTQRNGEKL
ncbi:MAG: MBL fold metallo-hydrolase [Pseudobdellovibrio sp.]|nr:MBL fold metallo-hydrolase [Pseudobdellovibrio sp.]